MKTAKLTLPRRGRYLLIVLLLLCSIFSFAEVSVDANGNVQGTEAIEQPMDPDIVTATTDKAIAAFTGVIKVAQDSIRSITIDKGLRQYGERLTMMLTGIVIVWGILKNIALKQSMPQLVGDLVFPLVIAAFVMGAGIAKLPGIIDSSTTTIARLFGSSGTSSLEIDLAKNILTAAARVWNADTAAEGTGQFLVAPLSTIAMLILRIGVVLLMLLSCALGVAAVLIAKFQIALAIALAPLLIPWIVFKPTEFLFSGWLNFFLKAGFGLVGVYAVSAVVVSGSQNMANLIGTTGVGHQGVLTFAAMAGMSVIFAYLMLKGSDIGEGIISGSATGIGQLASVAKGSVASSPGKMAGAALTGAGAVTKGGLAAASGKMVGSGKLSTGAESLASKSFGKRGTVARTVFEAARGGNGRSSPSSPPAQPPAVPQRTSLSQKLRERESK